MGKAFLSPNFLVQSTQKVFASTNIFSITLQRSNIITQVTPICPK